MAWMENLGERLEGKGWLGIGIGAVILAPVVFPPLARRLRPLAKGAVKGYLALSERARAALAEANEQMQDLVAEARSEYEQRGEGGQMMTLAPGSEEQTAAGAEAGEAGEADDGGRRESGPTAAEAA